MATNPCIPYFTDTKHITGKTTTAVVGKTFLEYAAGGNGGLPAVKTAEAGARPAGVAGYNQDEGKTVPFAIEGHVPVTAGEELAVGDRVKVGTGGKAVKIAPGEENLAVGTVYLGAAADADAAIHLSL